MEVYTDGSCIVGPDNERYAGAGIWFGPDDMRNTRVTIPSHLSTNQYAELLAVKYALTLCRNVKVLTIKTDSKYSINCVTVWCKAWKKNEWKTSNNKDVIHSSVIKDCLKILEYRETSGYSTSFVHVKAHSGILGNEGADVLAGLASSESCKKAIALTKARDDIL